MLRVKRFEAMQFAPQGFGFAEERIRISMIAFALSGFDQAPQFIVLSLCFLHDPVE